MVAIVTELRKLGATVEEGRDYCVITPPKKVRSSRQHSVVIEDGPHACKLLDVAP